jgi:hypothetical protein
MEFPLTQEEIQGLIDRQRAEIEELKTQLEIAHSQLKPISDITNAIERLMVHRVAYLLYVRRILIDGREMGEIRREIFEALVEEEARAKVTDAK